MTEAALAVVGHDVATAGERVADRAARLAPHAAGSPGRDAGANGPSGELAVAQYEPPFSPYAGQGLCAAVSASCGAQMEQYSRALMASDLPFMLRAPASKSTFGDFVHVMRSLDVKTSMSPVSTVAVM